MARRTVRIGLEIHAQIATASKIFSGAVITTRHFAFSHATPSTKLTFARVAEHRLRCTTKLACSAA